MGIEISQDHGGTGSTFFASILVIEELAKVDMSITVMVDIQNTLVNTLFMKHGTPQQTDCYLPRLATDTVSCAEEYLIFQSIKAFLIKSKLNICIFKSYLQLMPNFQIKTPLQAYFLTFQLFLFFFYIFLIFKLYMYIHFVLFIW